jgi:hypothetical protein
MEKKLIETHRALGVYFHSSPNLHINVYSRETIPFSMAKVVRAWML